MYIDDQMSLYILDFVSCFEADRRCKSEDEEYRARYKISLTVDV